MRTFLIVAGSVLLIVVITIGVYFYLYYGETVWPHVATQEQKMKMPGAGEIRCTQPGLYKIYFGTMEPLLPIPVSTASKEEKAKYVSEILKQSSRIQSSIVCEIENKTTHMIIPVLAPLVAEKNLSSEKGALTTIALNTFRAPSAGIYKIVSHSKDERVGSYILMIVPQGWTEWEAWSVYRSTRFIPKGTKMSSFDFASDTYMSAPPPPNNIVGNELDAQSLVGCTTNKDILPWSFIRYSDISLPTDREPPR